MSPPLKVTDSHMNDQMFDFVLSGVLKWGQSRGRTLLVFLGHHRLCGECGQSFSRMGTGGGWGEWQCFVFVVVAEHERHFF